jgi:hypothetical protein
MFCRRLAPSIDRRPVGDATSHDCALLRAANTSRACVNKSSGCHPSVEWLPSLYRAATVVMSPVMCPSSSHTAVLCPLSSGCGRPTRQHPESQVTTHESPSLLATHLTPSSASSQVNFCFDLDKLLNVWI